MGLAKWWKQKGGRDVLQAAAAEPGERKTTVAPLGWNSIFSPFRGVGVQNALPKPTAVNLRRFAETPAARRAINCIKDRIACMDWRLEARPGAAVDESGERSRRISALSRAFETPNESDSFRTLIEQVIEDVLVGGVAVKKLGLFALFAGVVLKFAKVIALSAAAFFGGIYKLFSRKKTQT